MKKFRGFSTYTHILEIIGIGKKVKALWLGIDQLLPDLILTIINISVSANKIILIMYCFGLNALSCDHNHLTGNRSQ